MPLLGVLYPFFLNQQQSSIPHAVVIEFLRSDCEVPIDKLDGRAMKVSSFDDFLKTEEHINII